MCALDSVLYEIRTKWKPMKNEWSLFFRCNFFFASFIFSIDFFYSTTTSPAIAFCFHCMCPLRSFVRSFCSYLSKVVNYKLMWLNPKTASPFTNSLIRLNMQYVIAHKSHRSLSLSFAQFSFESQREQKCHPKTMATNCNCYVHLHEHLSCFWIYKVFS